MQGPMIYNANYYIEVITGHQTVRNCRHNDDLGKYGVTSQSFHLNECFSMPLELYLSFSKGRAKKIIVKLFRRRISQQKNLSARNASRLLQLILSAGTN
jgi:hypothetical protein